MHSTKHFSFLFLCFLMSILLSACGSKGDLYQDEELKTAQETVSKEPQPNNENSEKKQP